MKPYLFAVLLLLSAAFSHLSALETRLRLGPNEISAEAALMNRYVREGVTRIDSTTLHAAGSVRFMNVGVNLDTYTALDRDRSTRIKSGEVDEVRVRLDYNWELAGLLQVLPYYETSLYPANGNHRTFNGRQADLGLSRKRWEREAHWLGVDAWYLLPWQGLEVGGGLAYDLTDNASWKGAIGARQFVQLGTLDIAAYEKLNFGYGNYRDHLIGLDRTGLTTAEIGVELTMPLPLEVVYLSAFAAGHIWVDSKSRDIMDRRTVLVGGVAVSIRTGRIGF